jgi:chemotaxis protein methyltransferase CheR
VRVRPEIASLVTFERANLVETAAQRGFDLVWCRNVLIYFTPDARRRVTERLVAATSPGGHLFVGYSESLRDVPQLQPVRAGDAVYYVRGPRVPPRTADLPVPVRRPELSELTPPPTRIPMLPPPDDVLVPARRPNAPASRTTSSTLSSRPTT